MITKEELSKIASYDTKGLIQIHSDLILERMKLDKDMSEFLHANEQTMSYEMENYQGIWNEYKHMSKMHSEVTKMIKLTEFYMARYNLI